MANYYASARSNYFEVKDEEAFLAEMNKIPGIEVDGVTFSDDVKRFCILGDDADGAGWTSFYLDEDDNEVEVDLPMVVADHLKDDEVAIFMEVGAEKLRYVIGYAVAVNNEGDIRTVSLDEIYNLGRELTDKPDNLTRAEY
jgi:hypothetical protein